METLKTNLPPDGLGHSFVFVLEENYKTARSLFNRRGFFTLGYIKAIDSPITQKVGTKFFLGRSAKQLICGPFVTRRAMYYDDSPLDFFRKEDGTPVVQRVPCNYRFDFVWDPSSELRSGMDWKRAQKIINVPSISWKNLVAVRLSGKQFLDLEIAMLELHEEQMNSRIPIRA